MYRSLLFLNCYAQIYIYDNIKSIENQVSSILNLSYYVKCLPCAIRLCRCEAIAWGEPCAMFCIFHQGKDPAPMSLFFISKILSIKNRCDPFYLYRMKSSRSFVSLNIFHRSFSRSLCDAIRRTHLWTSLFSNKRGYSLI